MDIEQFVAAMQQTEVSKDDPILALVQTLQVRVGTESENRLFWEEQYREYAGHCGNRMGWC